MWIHDLIKMGGLFLSIITMPLGIAGLYGSNFATKYVRELLFESNATNFVPKVVSYSIMSPFYCISIGCLIIGPVMAVTIIIGTAAYNALQEIKIFSTKKK